jgi:hypothetical protein
MDNKPPECFASDARARGVRIDLSPQRSIVLPHEHFVCAEYSAEQSVETLKLKFMTHEVTLAGYQLRRIENAILNRDLSWLCARPEKFRQQDSDRPFITDLKLRNLEKIGETDGNTAERRV